MTLYTRADTELSSSLVYEAYYNDNSGDLTVVLDNGHGYVYENVPSTVYDGLVNAGSPGAYYNAVVKRQYGRSTPLGYVGHDSVKFRQTTPLTSVPSKGLFTTENTVVTTEGARRITLGVEPAASTGRQYTVVFEVNGAKRTYRPDNVNSVDETVEALRNVSDALGVSTKVKEVVVSFE